jgi:Mg2+-importing ATPase
METSRQPLNETQRAVNVPSGQGAHASGQLLEKARTDTDALLKELDSQLDGLSEAQADSRRKQDGTNEIARAKRQSALIRLFGNIKNPLVLLLLSLGVLSFLTGASGQRWLFS